MNLRRTLVLGVVVAALGLIVPGLLGYVEERYTLPRVVNESTSIVVLQVEKVNKERKLIYYKKIADLKGNHPDQVIKHNVGVGGFNDQEKKIPIEWAEPGKIAIMFHNGTASETCLGKYWYQCYPGGEWWNHSHGEPYMTRTYCGDINELKAAVEKLLKNQEVIVPATVSKTDLRIQKVKADPKQPLAYIVVEAPAIAVAKLDDVKGFSSMVELPRPNGKLHGAIPVDVDGDSWLDLLLVGGEGLQLLRNNQKGGFEDVTDKWGLSKDPGCLTAAFADYEKSGRLSLFTSGGKLYTNLGDKFRDDSERLPMTPKRVENPGEAMAWIDVDHDGLPDLVCSVGSQGLAAWRNLGGKEGKWFEDISAKVNLGPTGLGTAAGNYLSALDVAGDGRAGFLFNLRTPLVVQNTKEGFKEVVDSGLSFPSLARPALAAADYRNSGQLALFTTTNERRGALLHWEMVGTFSAEEDKKLAAGPDFSPKVKPQVKIGEDSWSWQAIRAKDNGVLEIRRGDPTPNASYAFSTFAWPKAEKIRLFFGSENGITAWLNGKQVYQHKAQRPFTPDVESVEVEVKEGDNTVLLKMFDEGPLWRTTVRPSPLNLYPPAAVQLLQGDGKGKFVDVTSEAGDLAQLRGDSISAVWGDLNNDGSLDLIVTGKTGLVRVYLNQGDGKFHYATSDLGLEQKFKASGVVVGDFNKDGKLDLLLLGEGEAPPVLLYSNLKGKLTPVTVRCDGPATGAKVSVREAKGNKILGTRWNSGGDGKTLQAAQEAQFALAPGSYLLKVEVGGRVVESTQPLEVGQQALWTTISLRK